MPSDFLAVSRQATVKSIVSQFQKMAKQGARIPKKGSKAEAAAAANLASRGSKIEDLQFTFVVDRDNKFLGYIPLRKLILEKSSRKAQEIMQPAQVMVRPNEDQETVAQIFPRRPMFDVVIFDEKSVSDRATFQQPKQYPVGIEYVLVNGQITIEKGKHTGTKAGQILRHSERK